MTKWTILLISKVLAANENLQGPSMRDNSSLSSYELPSYSPISTALGQLTSTLYGTQTIMQTVDACCDRSCSQHYQPTRIAASNTSSMAVQISSTVYTSVNGVSTLTLTSPCLSTLSESTSTHDSTETSDIRHTVSTWIPASSSAVTIHNIHTNSSHNPSKYTEIGESAATSFETHYTNNGASNNRGSNGSVTPVGTTQTLKVNTLPISTGNNNTSVSVLTSHNLSTSLITSLRTASPTTNDTSTSYLTSIRLGTPLLTLTPLAKPSSQATNTGNITSIKLGTPLVTFQRISSVKKGISLRSSVTTYGNGSDRIPSAHSTTLLVSSISPTLVFNNVSNMPFSFTSAGSRSIADASSSLNTSDHQNSFNTAKSLTRPHTSSGLSSPLYFKNTTDIHQTASSATRSMGYPDFFPRTTVVRNTQTLTQTVTECCKGSCSTYKGTTVVVASSSSPVTIIVSPTSHTTIISLQTVTVQSQCYSTLGLSTPAAVNNFSPSNWVQSVESPGMASIQSSTGINKMTGSSSSIPARVTEISTRSGFVLATSAVETTNSGPLSAQTVTYLSTLSSHSIQLSVTPQPTPESSSDETTYVVITKPTILTLTNCHNQACTPTTVPISHTGTATLYGSPITYTTAVGSNIVTVQSFSVGTGSPVYSPGIGLPNSIPTQHLSSASSIVPTTGPTINPVPSVAGSPSGQPPETTRSLGNSTSHHSGAGSESPPSLETGSGEYPPSLQSSASQSVPSINTIANANTGYKAVLDTRLPFSALILSAFLNILL